MRLECILVDGGLRLTGGMVVNQDDKTEEHSLLSGEFIDYRKYIGVPIEIGTNYYLILEKVFVNVSGKTLTVESLEKEILFSYRRVYKRTVRLTGSNNNKTVGYTKWVEMVGEIPDVLYNTRSNIYKRNSHNMFSYSVTPDFKESFKNPINWIINKNNSLCIPDTCTIGQMVDLLKKETPNNIMYKKNIETGIISEYDFDDYITAYTYLSICTKVPNIEYDIRSAISNNMNLVVFKGKSWNLLDNKENLPNIEYKQRRRSIIMVDESTLNLILLTMGEHEFIVIGYNDAVTICKMLSNYYKK